VKGVAEFVNSVSIFVQAPSSAGWPEAGLAQLEYVADDWPGAEQRGLALKVVHPGAAVLVVSSVEVG
jgi:hypothetical protein